MSLDASRLSLAIATAMQVPAINAQPGAALTALCDAIATAMVNEITNHAVVLPGSTLLSAGMGSPVTGVGTVA